MRPALRTIILAIREAVAAWSPTTLFASGEQGAWYDPSDLTTMFQDAAGTVPVTAVEQPVGKILDKSGRGNHATQATAASRPVFKIDGNGKYYLYFDGVDDSLSTSSIDFTSTDKMTVFAGVRLSVYSPNSLIFNTGPDPTSTAGTFMLRLNAVTRVQQTLFGSTLSNFEPTISTIPVSLVTTSLLDIGASTGAENGLRINGAAASYAGNSAGTGNFGNQPLYMGRLAGTANPLNGNIYSLIIRGALSDAAQITATEAYVAGKTGVTL